MPHDSSHTEANLSWYYDDAHVPSAQGKFTSRRAIFFTTNLTNCVLLHFQTERTIKVEFSAAEKKEYDALDKAAREFYVQFKSRHGHKLSKYYLRLNSKLTPLRIAASGGRIPLDDEEDKDEKSQDVDEESEAESEDESPQSKKKKAKKEKRFSEFAYKSKINALIDELKRARDNDPKCKSVATFICYSLP